MLTTLGLKHHRTLATSSAQTLQECDRLPWQVASRFLRSLNSASGTNIQKLYTEERDLLVSFSNLSRPKSSFVAGKDPCFASAHSQA